ncbi:MAG: hypothetical protein QOJ35_3211 [Solirubrobacteraceae bacterium]|jgi:hypothetical protein|nr:hypothetical protein [Solirubrobacteraceae bacterium]
MVAVMALPRTAFVGRASLAALLLAVALLAGACGGKDKAAQQKQSVSRPQYVAAVNALCKKVMRQSRPINRKLQALVDASGTYSSRLRKAAPLLHQTYDRQSAKLRRFEAIAPPTGDRARIAALTTAAKAALADLAKGLPAADSGDLKNFIDTAFDATGSRAKAEQLGTDYGFDKTCFALPVDLSGVNIP